MERGYPIAGLGAPVVVFAINTDACTQATTCAMIPAVFYQPCPNAKPGVGLACGLDLCDTKEAPE
jgi:hypothetical protein